MRGCVAIVILCLTLLFGGVVRADEQQPQWILRLPESTPVAFVADTSKARFYRYERDGNNVVEAGSYYMSIGVAGAGKERSGDRRTPIGAYIVTEQLDTTRLHEKYGVMAFPLDYPNAWDRRLERSGDGIWVHGVDPHGGRRPERDTDGCIALPNEDLAALESVFLEGRTPVVIAAETAATTEDSNSVLAERLGVALERWAESQTAGDLHAYLSLYAEDFSRWSMNFDEWAAFSLQTLGERHIEKIDISDLLLLRYPGAERLFLARFTERVSEAGRVRESTRRLYWRLDERGELRIVAEDMG